MAKVAVLHNTLDFQGGADKVCLEACRALRADHDVTLFTISKTDVSALADRFDVDLGDVDVRMPPGAGAMARTLSGLAHWVGPQLAFRSVLLHRYATRSLSAFDIAVSTANEFSVPIPSVQYIHHPQFNRRRCSASEDAGRLNGLWSRVAGPDPGTTEGSVTLLANSSFTADAVESCYNSRPAVLYPPVDPISCDRSWTEREPGIVVVGRIAPDKRLFDAISLVESVRDRSLDVHLHIAGSAPRAYREYRDRVVTAARERPFVTVEPDVSRERVETLLCSHRVGLNLKEQEPFGMAVAEYVAAGMFPVVPDSGGQREIVGERSRMRYASLQEAVDQVSRAIQHEDPPTLQRDRFAAERFRAGFRQHVNRAIASSTRWSM